MLWLLIRSMIFVLLLALSASLTWAELASLAEEELALINGQGGLQLEGSVSVNANGGPLNQGPDASRTKPGATLAFRTREFAYVDENGFVVDVTGIEDPVAEGYRLESGTFLTFDNIRGKVSFAGVIINTVKLIDDPNSPDNGQETLDPDQFARSLDAVAIKLPSTLDFENFGFEFGVTEDGGEIPEATSEFYLQPVTNNGQVVGFEPVNDLGQSIELQSGPLLGVRIDGRLEAQGNLYFWPN